MEMTTFSYVTHDFYGFNYSDIIIDALDNLDAHLLDETANIDNYFDNK